MSRSKPQPSDLARRKEALSSLPPSVRLGLTAEETEIFLHQDLWPESLCEKLSDFLFPLDPDTPCPEKP
ncbi:hypothetical protein [Desulfobotulus sp.]|uniref:hypothetical protein n=1 Tax=Desulfobotulus sp. TaxID=1940337 RepID=UPI002A3621E4|nr:hypothetical protein [Desulfobotulus sp.]MDY0163181.1 hypothetical protein [Desulfobotulus sp.]